MIGSIESVKYGLDDIKNVYELYGSYYNLNIDDLLLERRDFTYEMYKNRNVPFRVQWKRNYGTISLKSPGHALLGRHHLIIPFDAAICDRGFSEQNLVITKDRTSIKTGYLRDSMIVCVEGPEWSEGKKVMKLMIRALNRFASCANYD